MVAKIKSGKSLIGALNYNENKVSQGKAILIAASGYPKDATALSFNDKLFRLTDLAAMNQRSKTNAVHISLNFPNGELLEDARLSEIAGDYLNGIGFQRQPFLVYRHNDAAHPHIHIVTTNIKRDGERINLHYVGQNESEKTRKAIEEKYDLIKAEQQPRQKPELKAEAAIAEYGKAETKRAITNVLSYIVRAYKFTSVPELNAVLAQYGIMADRGSKGSRMFAREGLLYRLLDKQGNKIGVPIKASTIYGSPTLNSLKDKFRLNEQLRKPFRAVLALTVYAVLSQPRTYRSFQQALYQKGIQCIYRHNEEGRLYGVTFIDRNNKSVFNGSDLGKAYSANALSIQLLPNPSKSVDVRQSNGYFTTHKDLSGNFNNDVLDILIATEQDDLAALKKFKKKKRSGQNL